jgi:hypothetical protein
MRLAARAEYIPAALFFRGTKQMFPVLSPEPEMIKNSVNPLGASSPDVSRVRYHFHPGHRKAGASFTSKRNSAKGARRNDIGRGQSGG